MKHLPDNWDQMMFPAQLKWLAENYGVYEKDKFGLQGYSKDAPEDVQAVIDDIEKMYAEAAKKGARIN